MEGSGADPASEKPPSRKTAGYPPDPEATRKLCGMERPRDQRRWRDEGRGHGGGPSRGGGGRGRGRQRGRRKMRRRRRRSGSAWRGEGVGEELAEPLAQRRGDDHAASMCGAEK